MSVERFDTYLVEVRGRFDTLLQQLVYISAGAQALTVSAFIGNDKVSYESINIALLVSGWVSLILCFLLSIATINVQIFALTRRGLEVSDALKKAKNNTEIKEVTENQYFAVPKHFRKYIWGLTLLASVSCAFGLTALCFACIDIIKNV